MSDDFDFDDVPAETPLSPEEAIIRRHRREKKNLQGKILSMKKCVNKNDKKKKKELEVEIVRLEAELEARQTLELDTFQPRRQAEPEPIAAEPPSPNVILKISHELERTNLGKEEHDEAEVTPMNTTLGTPKLSRAQKRRDKKESQEREKQKRIEQETEVLVENSEWKKEDKELERILGDLGLEVFDIPADGHCLYSAVSHQLGQHGKEAHSIEYLRRCTADYLKTRKDELIHYFDETITVSEESYLEYTNAIALTAAWGGQIEVRVMSNYLACPIRLIQATGPPLLFGEEFKAPVLTLTYHRHKIQAGEHYNSTLPKRASPEL